MPKNIKVLSFAVPNQASGQSLHIAQHARRRVEYLNECRARGAFSDGLPKERKRDQNSWFFIIGTLRYQAGQGTSTSKLSIMPGARKTWPQGRV
jgi:hypothetical protein